MAHAQARAAAKGQSFFNAGPRWFAGLLFDEGEFRSMCGRYLVLVVLALVLALVLVLQLRCYRCYCTEAVLMLLLLVPLKTNPLPT